MKYERLIEAIAGKVHDAWWETKKQGGFHHPNMCTHTDDALLRFNGSCPKCHKDMIPYDDLPEEIKEYDRVTARTVLKALMELGYSIVLD